MNHRILVVAAMAIVLLMAVGFVFAGLMLGGGRNVLSRAFSNLPMTKTVARLVEQGVIRAENDAVTVDEERLKTEVPRVRTRNQVKSLLPFIRAAADGQVTLDSRAVEVRYQTAASSGVRGTIWDRDGEILARSERDTRTQRSRRAYPLGAAGFPVVGASHPAFGDRGIEAAYRDELMRAEGVTLTVSAHVQGAAMEALGTRPGAAVVLAVPSDEILALASTPAFDPAERMSEAWLAAERDRDAKPFFNRAVAGRYPPGSLFKVVDLASWLESPDRDAQLTVNCTGTSTKHRIRDVHAHGPVKLEQAFARSCNLFFAEIGVQLGPRLLLTAERFGFNAPIALLPGRKGFTDVTSEAFITTRDNERHPWDARDFRRNPKVVAQSAIGQNLVVATPLQMAVVAATIAADGRRVEPVLVRSTGATPDRRERVGNNMPAVKPEIARAVMRMMVSVMTEGTGRGLPRLSRVGHEVRLGDVTAGAKPITVAGKTGTAEVGMKPGAVRPHAWFIGFAPAERPEIAVAVLIEHGGFGADVAGPVAMTLLAKGLEALWQPTSVAAKGQEWNRSRAPKS